MEENNKREIDEIQNNEDELNTNLENHKKIKTIDEKMLECSVCMENHSEEHPIIDHQCSSCSKDAWKICILCNEQLLSRICPFCRNDYSPILLYAVPGKIQSIIESS